MSTSATVRLPATLLLELKTEDRLRVAIRAYVELLGRHYPVFPIYIDLVRDYCVSVLGNEIEYLGVKQQLHTLKHITPVIAEFPEPVNGYHRLFYLINRDYSGELVEEYEFLSKLQLPYIGQYIGDWSDLSNLEPPSHQRKSLTNGPKYTVDLCADDYWDAMVFRRRLEAADNLLSGSKRRQEKRRKNS